MVRQAHLIAFVAFLIGCAVLLLAVGCSGPRSEAPQEGKGHTEATKKEQGSSPEATTSEEARCAGTQATKLPHLSEGIFITNDLPSCPNKGGLLLGTDKSDHLAGKEGDDEIRGLGGSDWIYGGLGSDVIYGGDGNDVLDSYAYTKNDVEGPRDKLYCGKGKDEYAADKKDYVDSSCEKKLVLGAA